MKNKQLLVFIIFSAFSLVGYASTGGSFAQSAPLQSYQSAKTTSNAPAVVPKAPPATTSEAAQMAKVKSIMAKSKKTVQSVGANPLGQAASKVRSVPSNLNAQTTRELESQMTDLNQAALMYQQNTNQKIENLRSENRALQGKLKNLTEALLMINEQLSQMATHANSSNTAASAALAQSAQDAPGGWTKTLQERFQGPTKYFAFAVLLLLLLLMTVLIKRSPKE